MSPDSPEARLSWLDAAPWLTEQGGDPEFFWIDDHPADADPEVARAHCDLIAVLIAETQPTVALGELLPLLPGGVDLIPDPNLPTRTANWLLASSTFTTDRIRDVTTSAILGSRGMGMGSVLPLLSRLVKLSTQADRVGGDHSDARRRAVDDVIRDLEIIARWWRATGDEDTPLLSELPAAAPSVARDAHRRLHALTAAAPAVAARATSVADQLSRRLQDLPERDLEVFVERRLTEERTRLEALGERFGVSRERVRQYEARALDDLYDWLENNSDAQFLIDSAVVVMDAVRPLAHVVAALPAIGEEVAAVGRPLWRVLVGIGAPFEVDGPWAASPTLQSAREKTQQLLLDRADDYGVVDPAALADLTAAALPDEDPRWRTDWVTALGHVVNREAILTRTGTIEDYAAAVLSLHGEPMTPEELVASFHVERSARSMVNQMTGDERFSRVSRTQWGLRAWGGREYATIRGAIGDLLDEVGGSAPLEQLVDSLAPRFDVKPASIVAYAAAPPYRTDDGIVTRTDHAPQPRKSPAQTRHLYRVGSAWKLRVTVNAEHLRGSGSPLPIALTTALGLEHGQSRQLSSAHGPQLVSWTSLQPSLGSVRRFFADTADDPPTEVFLVFTDDGGFDIEDARSSAEDPADRLLAAVGAPGSGAPVADPAAARSVLAVAVGLPEEASADTVRSALVARGEEDLADLVDG
ncbi:sigma factor-like helix-turn-helix DNA-binding protein [Gordonia phosphorivorans]|uniref:Sigma factor-like helix-turn-helix DNA-binding protein n=1 Tax=Gordonia phosphorivorans TaxID=1056982 RepID=A0ABV6HAP2_9ACTN